MNKNAHVHIYLPGLSAGTTSVINKARIKMRNIIENSKKLQLTRKTELDSDFIPMRFEAKGQAGHVTRIVF